MSIEWGKIYKTYLGFYMDKDMQNILNKLAELIYDYYVKNIVLKKIENSTAKAK